MKNWQRYKALIPFADWHVHTGYTDGQGRVDSYCQRALLNGLKSVAFTEHVRRRLDYDFGEYLSDVEHARLKYPLQILSGCEAKVLDESGRLDAPEDVLQRSDIVIGVFHSFPFKDRHAYVRCLCAMLENPLVQVWGHPLLFSRRHGMALSEEELARLAGICARNDILVEITGSVNHGPRHEGVVILSELLVELDVELVQDLVDLMEPAHPFVPDLVFGSLGCDAVYLQHQLFDLFLDLFGNEPVIEDKQLRLVHGLEIAVNLNQAQ